MFIKRKYSWIEALRYTQRIRNYNNQVCCTNWDTANTKSLVNLTPNSSGSYLSLVVDHWHSKTLVHNGKLYTAVQGSLSDRNLNLGKTENFCCCTDFFSEFSHCKKSGTQLSFVPSDPWDKAGLREKKKTVLKSNIHHNFTFAERHNSCNTLPFLF